MSEALRILEANNLMRHILLFKLFVESDGEAMKKCYKVKESIIELYGKEFSIEFLDQIRGI
ncbi:hypothetical protein [Psychroserpens sp.]